ncbi:alpha/beta hydrolase [Amycolatopsis sp. cg13]|uniref:alpha/beta hydrolase n=1 Tax=Amycolatopsis sp. cg13 TaxID=3238807 RepID=UPI003523C48B
MGFRYRGYSRTELDNQYSPSTRTANMREILTEYAVRSARARAARPGHSQLRYGPEPREALDLFAADQPDAPLLVFVHGGYWQELSKDESGFPAEGLSGASYAAVGYGLAPEYQLSEIVGQVRRGLWWLIAHAAELGFSPRRIHLAGHCAGACLVAAALQTGWLPDGSHPADVFSSAILLSGVYDLRPLQRTYVNDNVGLTPAQAAELSPLLHLPDRLPQLIVARGEAETDEFARQHDDLVRCAAPRASSVEEFVVAHRNHFDLPFDLDDPATVLGSAVFRRLGLSREPLIRP